MFHRIDCIDGNFYPIRLLYLTGIPQVTGQGGKGYCMMAPGQVNPLNFEVSQKLFQFLRLS